MRYFLIFVIVSSLVFGCKEKKEEEGTQDSTLSNMLEYKEVKEVDPCLHCDSIYSAFPKDSASFEIIYGYPHGSRYDGYEDISELFECLDKCYNYQKLLSVVKLQSNLEYNADATSHIRYNSSKFFMNHVDEAKKILGELSCSEFSKFIYFSFDRISRHDQFYDKYCHFLLDLRLEEPCKIRLLNDYCVLKNVETDEH